MLVHFELGGRQVAQGEDLSATIVAVLSRLFSFESMLPRNTNGLNREKIRLSERECAPWLTQRYFSPPSPPLPQAYY
jgi:hypothetical protein